MIRAFSSLLRSTARNTTYIAPRSAFSTASTSAVSKEEEQVARIANPDEEEYDALYKEVLIECRSHDNAVLKSYHKFLTTAAQHLDIHVEKTWQPLHPRLKTPYEFWRKDTLKSAFVHKKHRVQYEVRSYIYCFLLKRMTGSTLDTFLEYTQRNLPEGVGMKVTKTRIEKIPPHITPPKVVENPKLMPPTAAESSEVIDENLNEQSK